MVTHLGVGFGAPGGLGRGDTGPQKREPCWLAGWLAGTVVLAVLCCLAYDNKVVLECNGFMLASIHSFELHFFFFVLYSF
jgi:hypothetical protein